MLLIPPMIALLANTLCYVLGKDYFLSNIIVFGGYFLMIFPFLDKKYIEQHWKTLTAFFAFSTVTTTILELIFIHTDTWAFSSQINHMVGINLIGIPIEEFIFWEGCPLVVISTYIYYKKLPTTITVGEVADAISGVETVVETKEVSGDAITNAEMFVDDLIVDDSDGLPSYFRGAKMPVYTMFVAFVVWSIFEMRSYASGNYKAIALTVLAFFFGIMPYEHYALLTHTWIYNMDKMTGITLIGVPIEEWIVYFTCPTAGCLFLELFGTKLGNKL